MSMNNDCRFTGYIGNEPSTRTVGDNTTHTSFRLGVTRNWKPQNAEKYETDWFSVDIRNCRIADRLYKGQKVSVKGELEMRTYTDNQGQQQSIWELKCQPNDIALMQQVQQEGQAAQQPAQKRTHTDPGTGMMCDWDAAKNAWGPWYKPQPATPPPAPAAPPPPAPGPGDANYNPPMPNIENPFFDQ